MCTGIEIAMLVVAAAGAAEQGIQGYRRGKAAEVEAHQMDIDADNELQAASDRADLVRKAGAKTRSAARAAYAAAGVDVNEGSPLQIDQEIGQDVEHDAWAEILTGRSTANRMRQQANQVRAGGKNAADQSAWAAGGSLLSAGAQAYRGGWSSRPREQQAPAPITDRSFNRDRSIQVNV